MQSKQQKILIDINGLIIKSCNTIFNIQFLSNHSLLRTFPLVDSIFSSLFLMSLSEKVTIEKVETYSPLLQGIYDFTFCRENDNQRDYIVWVIMDMTFTYENLKRIQQNRQEQLIKKERTLIFSQK